MGELALIINTSCSLFIVKFSNNLIIEIPFLLLFPSLPNVWSHLERWNGRVLCACFCFVLFFFNLRNRGLSWSDFSFHSALPLWLYKAPCLMNLSPLIFTPLSFSTHLENLFKIVSLKEWIYVDRLSGTGIGGGKLFGNVGERGLLKGL